MVATASMKNKKVLNVLQLFACGRPVGIPNREQTSREEALFKHAIAEQERWATQISALEDELDKANTSFEFFMRHGLKEKAVSALQQRDKLLRDITFIRDMSDTYDSHKRGLVKAKVQHDAALPLREMRMLEQHYIAEAHSALTTHIPEQDPAESEKAKQLSLLIKESQASRAECEQLYDDRNKEEFERRIAQMARVPGNKPFFATPSLEARVPVTGTFSSLGTTRIRVPLYE